MAFSVNFLNPLNKPTPTPAPDRGGPVPCIGGPVAFVFRASETVNHRFSMPGKIRQTNLAMFFGILILFMVFFVFLIYYWLKMAN